MKEESPETPAHVNGGSCQIKYLGRQGFPSQGKEFKPLVDKKRKLNGFWLNYQQNFQKN